MASITVNYSEGSESHELEPLPKQSAGGGITTETDPTIADWAKASTKPTYTAAEVGALPDTTVIPTKTSDLTNDSGYLTSYTETDPTVPDWAKASTKPKYTADEVGALPNTTVIPTKTSDLANDSGYITSYTETDPTVPDWAKASTKPTYTAAEVGALADTVAVPSALSDLTEDSTHRVVTDAEKTAWNAKAAIPKSVLVTLTAAGWDSDAKTQTVTVSGVLADESKQIVFPYPSSSSIVAYNAAGILCTGRAADSLTFTAETVPTVDLTIYVAIQSVAS